MVRGGRAGGLGGAHGAARGLPGLRTTATSKAEGLDSASLVQTIGLCAPGEAEPTPGACASAQDCCALDHKQRQRRRSTSVT
mmetsp:Transcript_20559/g.32748  ORF Transcript_20559/g.32748 Transcript_20559/m.32748 type:complete len:82 (+) Transcript_20559:836-1081(+)